MRGALRGLDSRNAERVAAHLVAAGTVLEEDPAAALAHARAARDRASRVAAVREAVGVAAYHAEDYAEAARELRAYRRMSGDSGYRAVLADCERALGRPEVALRLVAEALVEGPDPEEAAELRIVESGARRDLGEDAAARLVLEAALGGRLDPASLEAGDTVRLRLASAYADLLQLQGEPELAAEWLVAIAAADPDDLIGAVDRLGIRFTDLEDEPAGEGQPGAPSPLDAGRVGAADETPREVAAPDGGTPQPWDDQDRGHGFDEDVEAEVAELLGEVEAPPDAADPN